MLVNPISYISFMSLLSKITAAAAAEQCALTSISDYMAVGSSGLCHRSTESESRKFHGDRTRDPGPPNELKLKNATVEIWATAPQPTTKSHNSRVESCSKHYSKRKNSGNLNLNESNCSASPLLCDLCSNNVERKFVFFEFRRGINC